MEREIAVLRGYIRSKNLRNTPQREVILKIFLATEKHLSIGELHKIVEKKNPSIGYTTTYRTMKLLSECGLCSEIDLGDGVQRFEHKYGHGHHDHIVCTKCGRLIEAVKPELEKTQEELAGEKGFIMTHHKLQIFGLCSKCRK